MKNNNDEVTLNKTIHTIDANIFIISRHFKFKIKAIKEIIISHRIRAQYQHETFDSSKLCKQTSRETVAVKLLCSIVQNIINKLPITHTCALTIHTHKTCFTTFKYRHIITITVNGKTQLNIRQLPDRTRIPVKHE